MSWIKPLRLELKVAQIIHQQELNGVMFDLPKAYECINDLENQKGELYQEIRKYLKHEVNIPYPKPIEEPFKRNGEYKVTVTNWYEDPSIVCGAFSRVLFEEPSLGSRQKLMVQLLDHGWEPELYTDKGSPKLTDKGEPVPSLFKIKAPIGKQIARWYVLSHRQSQIQGWIDRVRPDQRLTAAANSCGTNTARMKHKIVVNVPKAADQVIYGYEMRDLFIASPDMWMVGYDASGLEARMMGHYTTPFDDGYFGNELLNGDIHSKNAKIFFPKQVGNKNRGDEGFEEYRDLAKTVFYALIYGAQGEKISSIIGCSASEAKGLIENFWDANPALGKLRAKVIKLAERYGYIPGLDGRKIYIRSPHSSMNALFQSGGAIAMKVSMVLLDHWARKAGLNFRKVIDMHDEGQSEVPKSDVFTFRGTSEEALLSEIENRIVTKIRKDGGDYTAQYTQYGELAVKSIRKAGEILQMRTALDAEYKVGRSWAETH